MNNNKKSSRSLSTCSLLVFVSTGKKLFRCWVVRITNFPFPFFHRIPNLARLQQTVSITSEKCLFFCVVAICLSATNKTYFVNWFTWSVLLAVSVCVHVVIVVALNYRTDAMECKKMLGKAIWFDFVKGVASYISHNRFVFIGMASVRTTYGIWNVVTTPMRSHKHNYKQ